jgi:ABC-type multidrug transport system fused ATPase/permease subunit
MRLPFAAARSLLLTYLRPQKWWVAALGALLVGSIALQLVAPQVLRGFIDVATGATGATPPGSADPAPGLTWLATLFMVVAVAQQVLAIGATYVGERVGWSATNGLRADLARHCLALDLGFHKQRTPGELIERIDGDVTDLADFFSLFVLEIVANVLLLAGVLLALWLESWLVALPYTIFVALALGLLFSIQGLPVPYWRAFRQASAELFGFLEERLGGTEDIRSSGAAGYVMHRLYERTRGRYQTGVRARVMNSPQWTMPIFIHAVGTGVVFCTTAVLFAQGGLTLGDAFLVYAYAGLSFRPLRVITREIEQFQKASAALLRITDLMRTRSTLPDGPGAPLPPGALAVSFEDVAFGYGEPQLVLEGTTFRLQAGEVLGLLGRTGSGKTTLARLLFRLYDPAAGTISLGGAPSGAPSGAPDGVADGAPWVDLRQPRLAQLRSRVAMVTQDVQLFRATVRENVTLFDAGIEDARIERALDDLGLGEWRRALPRGLDSLLGGDGAGLSAGEAQLLAFTRAFLRDPGLVVLDEASSRLDPATERLIERAVGALLRGRTAIIIAHRLGTVQRADRIMILEAGRILEHGPRQALAADPGSRFSSLLRSGMEQVLA